MSKAEKLKSCVPDKISQISQFKAIYDVQGAELDNIYTAVDDTVNQCFIGTATWGLKFWERMLDIPPDEAKEAAYRRDVILSKIKGTGTVTVSLIDTVAESYDNGSIDIIEHPDIHSFEVKFVGTRGVPPNLSDLRNAIDNLKPAHLTVTYTFTYTLWSELKAVSWGSLRNYTWEQVKTRSWS